ncbi:hypothetical protein C8R43DRAFT_631151 [Mycena crocata]|nr:hypothetical protein C8R43DRAFT_631151 [Mycena crocata]
MADVDTPTATYTPVQTMILCLVTAGLSLIPNPFLHYIGLAIIISSSFIVHAIRHHRPSIHLRRINKAVAVTVQLLARAKLECARDQFELAAEERRLVEVKLAASRIQSLLLGACDAPWKIYLQTMRAVFLSLDNCEREIHKVQTATLLIIEAEHQRKLEHDINESLGILNAVARYPGKRSYSTARNFECNQTMQV